MRKYFYLIGVILIIVIMAGLSTQLPTPTPEPQGKYHTFYPGEILYPDYACPDTMIVVNAQALNEIFDGRTLPTPATDSEIDSVIHLYCIPVPDCIFNIGDDGPNRISVQFREGEKEYGYDYLTLDEFIEIFITKK